MADIRSLEARAAVRVRERLPGIEPSHFCTRCPTFFRCRDRFYLTSIREDMVHGIAVWPHHERRLRVEWGRDGLVLMFSDGATVLVTHDEIPAVLDDFFWGNGHNEIDSWARRRGFDVRLTPRGQGLVSVRFEPSGPHLPLLVVKAWLRNRWARSCEDALGVLAAVGTRPQLFPPADLDA